jgi:hypothetical protein
MAIEGREVCPDGREVFDKSSPTPLVASHQGFRKRSVAEGA